MDDAVSDSITCKRLREEGYFYGRSRELLVYPDLIGGFREGADISDHSSGLILPWSEVLIQVPRSELRGGNKVLFVDPFQIENGFVQVASLILINQFARDIHGLKAIGKVHPQTRVAIEASEETLAELS